MTDTQHFMVSIDEGNSQGVYCAYCGEKIIPSKDDLGGYSFQCSCNDALSEQRLYQMKADVEKELGAFLQEKTTSMQINEIRTRIVIYEQHTHGLKIKLQELMNREAGVVPEEGVSTLVVKLPEPEEVPMELFDEVFVGPEDESNLAQADLHVSSNFSIPEEIPEGEELSEEAFEEIVLPAEELPIIEESVPFAEEFEEEEGIL